MSQSYDLQLAYALGKPQAQAGFKQQTSDFIVRERLGFEPSGEGEHVYVQVRKTAANTAWVGENIARYLDIKEFDVTYAGRKDRHAVTTQWFSCRLPGKQEPDWAGFDVAGVEILGHSRHQKKLRRGEHAGNEFEIRLRQVQGHDLEARLEKIRLQGFPNYFGEQRFGRQGSNLLAADALFSGQVVRREQRDLCLSAVRSYMFNQDLAAQILAGAYADQCVAEFQWQLPADDRAAEAGRKRGRSRDRENTQTRGRDAAVTPESIPRGWLYGLSRQENPALQSLEQRFPDWCQGLARLALKAQQRDLWVRPAALTWSFEESDLLLSFGLPAGSFATSLLREIVDYGER